MRDPQCVTMSVLVTWGRFWACFRHIWWVLSSLAMPDAETEFHSSQANNALGITHAVYSLAMTLGFTSIQAHIDTLKLLFLQSLCKPGPDELANKLFNLRLLQFKTTRTYHMIGFIPDVHRVPSKYALTPYIDEYCNTGVYEEELTWIERLKSCRDFDRFHKVHTFLTKANVWRVASERPESATAMKFLARLLCTRTTDHQSNTCDLCLKIYSDKVYHVLFKCECNNRVNIIQVFYDMTTYKFGKS